ncbi:MAG: type II/IV secretion system ATPase subunit, partial [Nitrososphaerales archaeon]
LIEYGRSFLISGGTAAGKTTLLNAISMLIKPENKIVSVEDTPEINLAHPNWIQAVTRVGFGEGAPSGMSGLSGISGVSAHGGKSAGDITLFDLLITALRQRPDFIIVGEVRGEEAYTLFQAISVGHATMGTIHAASMTELLARVESQPMNVPRVMVANLDLVIFVAAVRRGDEKVRRMKEVVEILGVNPSTKEIITNTVFTWDPVKDAYEFHERSFQIEKISKAYGIPMEKLDAEIAQRVQLLERMIKEGITNYKAVTDIIRQYYLDKEAVLRASRLTSITTSETPDEASWAEAVFAEKTTDKAGPPSS